MARSYRSNRARPVNPDKEYGIRGAHYDTDGTLIGGYTPEGAPLGNKRRRGDGSAGAQWRQPAATSGTAPATGALLASRKKLFAEMEKAGPDAITPQMREQARKMGVQDENFNRAASRIRTNSAYSPNPAPKENQSNPSPIKNAPAQGPLTPAQVRNNEMRAKGLNPLTGQPMGASVKPRWKQPAEGWNEATTIPNPPKGPVAPPVSPTADTAKFDTVVTGTSWKRPMRTAGI